MKKWIILILVVAIIGGVWYWLRTYAQPFTPVWYQPKFGKVTHGDIRVPITAAGLIEPNQRIEVKSKASGEVIERPVDEGKFVRKGDILLVLKPDDEERRKDAAEAELVRALALEAQARASVEKAKANIVSAEADVARLVAQCKSSAFEFKKTEDTPEAYSEQETLNIDTQHKVNLAQKQSAEARLDAAHSALIESQETVKLQAAAVTVARSNLGDAQERLAETTIVAKHDAMVTDVRVKISEVIQGGMNTLTGGTVIMYLADVSTKKVVTRVDESDYGRVLDISPITALPEMPGLRAAIADSADGLERRGGKVRLTVDAFPEEEFEGIIDRVEPQGRLNQGAAIIQYNVHVVITDPQAHKLPLGAQAQVEFTVESVTNVVRVPSEAVKSDQGQRGVWLQVPPEPGSNEQWGQLFVACRFGITDGEFTQVIKVLDDVKLEKGAVLYTKLPVDRSQLED
ncbi:MAG: biotin/lipoyl-binding protein [Planctomycetota bacterium]